MRQSLLFFLCAISASVINAVPKLEPRIINGAEAAEGQFPWQVAMYVTNMHGGTWCGGTLISDRWIVTAGHCLKYATHFKIALGSNALVGKDLNRVVLNSTTYILHEEYNPQTLRNDIGLILLPQSVPFNEHIHPINLNSESLNVAIGTIVTVSGWGLTSDSESSPSIDLKFVSLKIISDSQCSKSFGTLNKGVVCAEKIGDVNQGTCEGDSGGPLVAYSREGPVHVGVVSFGHSDGCETGYPSAFARTDYYRNWIREKTGI